ncbi:MAG TPA: hypothetical protein PKK60_02465 [archaeon]|nr:hypothetical protein [archaeon]
MNRFDLKNLFFEEDGDGNFSSVYLILVFAIAALALILVVKPLYQNAQKTIPKATSSSTTVK